MNLTYHTLMRSCYKPDKIFSNAWWDRRLKGLKEPRLAHSFHPVFIFTRHFVPRSESFAFRMRRPKGDNQLFSTIYKKFPENTL